MKRKTITSLLLLSLITVFAQEETTTTAATSGDLSDNLDLEAVISVFGESKDLEDFEKRINDPANKISNLDLNDDGKVDYLRVVNTTKGNTQTVTVQAVIGKDQYQDVATIDVEKDEHEKSTVQIIGAPYIYGPGYIITPVYATPPVIVVWFWGPFFRPWISPWYWGYYPPFFRPWAPFPPYMYHTSVRVHVNIHNSYHHTTIRRNHHSPELHNSMSKNHHRDQHSNNSFKDRNPGMNNRRDLEMNRGGTFTRSSFPSNFGTRRNGNRR